MLASNNIPLKSTQPVLTDEYDTLESTLKFHRALQCFGESICDLPLLYDLNPDVVDSAINLFLDTKGGSHNAA